VRSRWLDSTDEALSIKRLRNNKSQWQTISIELMTSPDYTYSIFKDGWMLTKFFFVCLWANAESRSTERGQYPTMSTEQAWPIMDNLLRGFRRIFPREIQRVGLIRQESAILPAHGASYVIESI